MFHNWIKTLSNALSYFINPNLSNRRTEQEEFTLSSLKEFESHQPKLWYLTPTVYHLRRAVILHHRLRSVVRYRLNQEWAGQIGRITKFEESFVLVYDLIFFEVVDKNKTRCREMV
ncbi:hypothetical protein ABKV19_009172 [Rosa sericea]